MADHGTESTDMGIGLALILGFLALASAVAMFVTAPTPDAGAWFVDAMVFGVLLIVAIHWWDA